MVSRKKLAIIVGAVVLLIALLMLVLYIGVTSTFNQFKPLPLVTGPISFSSAIAATGVATYNNGTQLVEYGQINYQVLNDTSANFSISTYARDPVFRVYLVDPGTSCYECLNYTALYAALRSDLLAKGILHNSTSLQNVTLYNLSTITPNSMVIFATGLMPAEALPGTGIPRPAGESNTTILSLMRQGDYVFYIGYDFSRVVQGSSTPYITNSSTLSILRQNNIVTFSPVYNPNFGLNVSAQTFSFRGIGGWEEGPVAYVYPNNQSNGLYGSNAALLAITVPPQVAWKNVSIAASDISKVIVLRFWMPLLFYGSDTLNATDLGSAGNFTLLSTDIPLANTANVSRVINNSYGVIRLAISNDNATIAKELPFTLRYHTNSTLAMPSLVGYGDNVTLNLTVNSNSMNRILFSINVMNRTLRPDGAPLRIGIFNVPLSIAPSRQFKDLSTDAYYFATLVDSNGNKYSTALFEMPSLNITLLSSNLANDSFLWGVESVGQPLNNGTYEISINGAYNASGVVQNGEFEYVLPRGTALPAGKNYVYMYLEGQYYWINLYIPQAAGIPALYIEFGIAGVVVLLLNLILRAPNREEYYIDVSELPPAKKMDVTLTGDAIVNLFDTINYHYKWKYMPLTPEEMRTGISTNIRVNNTPVAVTLQNTNEVLYQLANDGKLLYQNEYYMPSKWANASKHDIEYLIVFRKLRDFLVEHAVFFTDLDTSSEADMMITVKGRQVPLFIYSSTSGMKNVPVHQSHKTVIVFISDEAREEFQDRLYIASGSKAELMRLSLENGVIELIDTENLDGLLY